MSDAKLEKLKQEVAESFIDMRLEEGWTRKEASRQLDMVYSNLTRLESGGVNMRLSTMHELAQSYGYQLEIGFVPIEESYISEGETDGEDPNDVPEESRGSVPGSDGSASAMPLGA